MATTLPTVEGRSVELSNETLAELRSAIESSKRDSDASPTRQQ